jgi:hypothetical protein
LRPCSGQSGQCRRTLNSQLEEFSKSQSPPTPRERVPEFNLKYVSTLLTNNPKHLHFSEHQNLPSFIQEKPDGKITITTFTPSPTIGFLSKHKDTLIMLASAVAALATTLLVAYALGSALLLTQWTWVHLSFSLTAFKLYHSLLNSYFEY